MSKTFPFKPKTVQQVSRLAQIINTFMRHGFRSFVEDAKVLTELTPEQRRIAEEISNEVVESSQTGTSRRKKLALHFRLALEELGPTFVKLGQLLCSREDLLPSDFIEELSGLHSGVKALPYSVVLKVLEDELGLGFREKFQTIDESPLAAGSIGQVHAAVLKDGSSVVIKVQRPGIGEQIQTDLSLMEYLAAFIENYSADLKQLRPKDNIKELSRGILGELDFVREGGFTAKIGENFTDHPSVVVPRIYWDLSTSKVLVMEQLLGVKIDESTGLRESGIDPRTLAKVGLEMFLKMVFIDGIFHGDLHAGNLFALPGNRLGVIDFGLCIRLSRATRETLAAMIIALINEDFEMMISHFIELSDPDASFDPKVFEDVVASEISPLMGLSLENVQLGSLFWKLARAAAQNGAPMPRQLLVFVKTLSTFEAIGKKLDPDLDIVRIFQEFGAELSQKLYSRDQLERQALIIGRDLASLARHGPRQVRQLLGQLHAGDLKITVSAPDLETTRVTFERVMIRLSQTLLVSSLILGSSLLVLARVDSGFSGIPSVAMVGFVAAAVLAAYTFLNPFGK